MTPLHVAQVCADRGVAPGGTKGASQHLRGIAAGVIDLGHRVTTFAARAPEGDFPAPVVGLDELASCGDVDAVYERHSLGHLGGLDRARALGVPFVLEVNAPLVAEAERHRPGTVDARHTAVERELLAAADLVIAVSHELAAWVDDHRDGPTVVQPNGFAPEWFRRAPSAAPSHELAFLGHPKPWHGAPRIVELLVALRRLGHRPATLVVGGGAGADELQAAARAAGVDDQVTITGALPPAAASVRLADALIGLAPYPRQRPFYFCPLKVVDYLAAGLAVVSTDQGDVAGLVGDAGVVVDPDDDAALVDAVRALLDDPARARELGRRGRRRAFAEMTWGHVAARSLAAIAALVPAGAR